MAVSLGTAYIKIAPDLTGVQNKISGTLNREVSKAGAEAGKGFGGSFSSALKGVAIGAGATIAYKAINAITGSVGDAVKRFDTLQNAPKVLQNLGYSATGASNAIKAVDLSTRGLPTSLDQIVGSLVSIASASGLGIDEATALTVAFNNMALSGGKGPAEAERALLQFTQALGRGKFQAQDFNIMMEVMPAQLNQVAKSLLGADSNAQKLRTALTNGEVSVDDFNKALIDLDKNGGVGFASFAQQAQDSTKGIGTAFKNMMTAIVRGVTNIIDAVGGDTITSALRIMRIGIDMVSSAVAKFIQYVKSSEYIAIFFSALGHIIGVVFREAWDMIKKSMEDVWRVLEPFAPQLKILGAVILVGLVAPLVMLIATLTAIITIITAVVTAISWFVARTVEFVQFMVNGFVIGVNAIKSVFNSLTGFFVGFWNSIVGLFGRIGSAIGNAIGNSVRGAIRAVIGGAVNIINGFINAINTVINVINKLPGVSIGKVGKLEVPALASGGITTGPTLAMIGEGKEQEAVLPLSYLDKMISGDGKGTTVNQTNNVYTEIDMNVVNRQLTWELNRS